jgi:hypothetical protein|tara:strand:- start:10406 stop:12355 length:1950 start_codon:yes stop_codon:yes gene_type:complete
MADAKQRLLIEIQTKNEKALGKLNKNINGLSKSTLGLGTAAKAALGVFAAIGATRIIKGFVNVGRQVESLRLRFKFLFGSAKEGAKAFEVLTQYAGTVPFSLEQIAAAAGNLAVVSKTAEDLADNLFITGNVAAISGLDFKTAGEQIQRSLTGGISAADLLRDKGIKALLGFKDGVKITADATAEALERDFGPDGKFGQAAIALANTFDGMISMIGDKWFNFQKIVGEAGGFTQLKAATGLLDDYLAGKFGNIEEHAKKIGQGIITASEDIILGSGSILDAVSPVFRVLKNSWNNILTATDALPGAIKTLGVIGFFMLGLTGKAIVLTIGASLGTITSLFADFMDMQAWGMDKLATLHDALGLTEAAEEYRVAANSLRGENDALRKKFDQLGKTYSVTDKKLEILLMDMKEGKLTTGKFTEQALILIQALRDKSEALNILEADMDAMIAKNAQATDSELTLLEAINSITGALGGGFKKAMKDAEDYTKSLGKVGENIFNGMADGLADFVMTGKINFRDFANSVIRDLLRIFARWALMKGIEAIVGYFTGGASTAVTGVVKPGTKQHGGSVSGGSPYIVGEAGPEMFVPNTSGNIIPNNQMGAEAGGEVTVNFNVTAMDASSFDEMLLERKGLIIGTIQQAFRQQGRRFA